MKSKTEIERLIQEDMTKRDQRTNPDPKDFLIRRHILEFDHSQEEAEQIFDITIKKVLLLTYPNYFEISQGKFQPKASLEESLRATLYQALGCALPRSSSVSIDLEVKPSLFDFEQLDLLFAQDKECVWLALKEAIPVGTHSSSVPIGKSTHRVLGDNRIQYATIDKVRNYLDLAKAFQAGTSSQIGQTVRRVSGLIATNVLTVAKNVGIDLGLRTSTQVAKIVTPGYESGMAGCMKMIDRAIECAGTDPISLELIEKELKPSTNSHMKKVAYDNVLSELSNDEINALLQSDLKLALDENRPDNLGHSITNTALKLLPPFSLPILKNLAKKLNALEANKLGHQASTVDMDTKMSAASILGSRDQLKAVDKIIHSNHTTEPHSSKGQRLEVAQAVQDYLLGHHSNWFIICDAKRRNPDWQTPESILKMFGSSPLKTLVEQIELTDPNAKEKARLYGCVEELIRHISKASAVLLVDAMQGNLRAITMTQLFAMKNELRNALGTGTEKCRQLESALEEIHQYIKTNTTATQPRINYTGLK